MKPEQKEFEQMLPDPEKILDRAITLRREDRTLIPGEALRKAFEEIGTTPLDHDLLYYDLLPKVKKEEKARNHRERRPDLF